MRKIENHIDGHGGRADRRGSAPVEPDVAVDGGDLDVAAAPADPLLPEADEAVGLLGVDDRVRLEDRPPAAHLGPEGGEGVLGEGGAEDLPAERVHVLARVELGPAGETGEEAEGVLRAARGSGRRDVLEGDEALDVVRVGAPLLDVGGHGADLPVGQVAGHLREGVLGVDDVGVHDQDGLGPIVLPQDVEAEVERVGLALAARDPAEVEDVAGELPGLGDHDVRGLVVGRVVDHVDAQAPARVVEPHEAVDRRRRSRRPRSRRE